MNKLQRDTMNKIESIQKEARNNKWPYPKTFEALKAAGVTSYTVILGEHYRAIYSGPMGYLEHKDVENYNPIKISKHFSSEKVKQALTAHTTGKTNYIGFLEDIAAAGIFHYNVNMHTREIHYYNLDETQYHQESIPTLK